MSIIVGAFVALTPDGQTEPISRPMAEEVPIAIEVNGIGYAVLMATGASLDDLGYGFAISERLIERADQLLDIEPHRTEKGVILRITLSAECGVRIHARIRHRSSDSSCGLCGIENLEQAMRPLPRLPRRSATDVDAVFSALRHFRKHQLLNQETGAAHAAAACGPDGEIHLLREDVGRHNAFDKLIGAMTRSGLRWNGGFALLSSRCSYELVEKAVLAGCPTLVTISAPTSLAMTRANEAGLELLVLARPDRILRMMPEERAS